MKNKISKWRIFSMNVVDEIDFEQKQGRPTFTHAHFTDEIPFRVDNAFYLR